MLSGTHTGSPQQLFTLQTLPGGHTRLSQSWSDSHAVLPGTQMPPPPATLPHTQSTFVEHDVNDPHVAPAHSGRLGVPTSAAPAGVWMVVSTGAAQATPAARPGA